MRYLPGRFIKHNKSTRTPNNLCFIDTETYPVSIPGNDRRKLHRLRLGVARNLRVESGKPGRPKEVTFYRSDYFWDWLFGRSDVRRPLWVFAHNVGFDLTVLGLWEQIEKGRIELYGEESESQAGDGRNLGTRFKGLFIDADLPTVIKCRWAADKSVLWFVDSGNYFRCSLEQVAEAEKIAYVPLPGPEATLPEWEKRCRNDVDIVQAGILSLMRMVRENDLGVWKTTIAGQSYAAFRHRFMTHSILPHNDVECRKLEREGYHGGEVRVLFCGRVVPDLRSEPLPPVQPIVQPVPQLDGPVYVLDVNSLYPYVMSVHDYPVQLIDRREKFSAEELARLPTGVVAISKVTLDARSRDYPIKYRGGLYHGMGRFVTTLCGPELSSACQAGDVESIGETQLYIAKPIFRTFVNELYGLRMRYREDGNCAFADICKTLLTSLHGKFGQWGNLLIPAPEVDSPIPYGTFHQRVIKHERLHSKGRSAIMGDGEEIVQVSRVSRKLRAIAWHTFEVLENVERDESFPAISAFVTAYGREYMRSLRSIAGQRQVFYQDTDSLHVGSEGYNRLLASGSVDGKVLGKLKLVSTAAYAEYRGIKSYTLDGVNTEAGLKKSAKWNERGWYTEQQFQRLGEVLSSQPAPGIMVSEVDKLPAQHDIRGMVGKDGWVTPINKVWSEDNGQS